MFARQLLRAEMARAKKRKPRNKPIKVLKPKFQYSVENMKNAVNDVREGKMNIFAAAKLHKVPRTTLYKMLRGLASPDVRKFGPEAVLGKEFEDRVVQWILDLASKGFPVSKLQLLDSIQQYVNNSDQAVPFKNKRPGRHWYESFLKRHPDITTRTSQNLTKSRANVSKQALINWHQRLETYLKEKGLFDILKDPSRVFNADETAFFLSPKAGAVLAKKGAQNVYSVVNTDEKENLTVMMGANAAGTQLPPMIVFEYKRIPVNISASVPKSWGLGRSDSGWMTCPVFYEYIGNIVHPWLEKNEIQRPILFFLDGHSSHLSLHTSDLCRELGIELFALHPNATHCIQPMDVAVFRTLKATWRERVAEWRLRNDGRQLKKENFCSLLERVINDALNPEIIMNGFRKCGLVPWDIHAVDFGKLTSDHSEKENDDHPFSMYELKTALRLIETEIGKSKKEEFQNKQKLKDALPLPQEDIHLYQVWLSFTKKMDDLSKDEQNVMPEPSTPNAAEISVITPAISSTNISTPIDVSSLPVEMDPDNFPAGFNAGSSTSNASHIVDLQDMDPVDTVLRDMDEDFMRLLSEPEGISNVEVEIAEQPQISVPDKSTNLDTEPEGISNVEVEIAEQPQISVPDKSTNLDKDIPTPFKKSFHWPEQEKKGGEKDKNSKKKEVFPSAITGSPWRQYWLEKKAKKEEEEKEKLERKLQRELKKQEKLKKQEELLQQRKERRGKQPAKKPKLSVQTKPRRRLFQSSSDDASEDVDEPDTSETDDTDETDAVEDSSQLRNLKKDEYVIFQYEGEYFPGIVQDVTKTGAKIKAMSMAGPDGWKWPERDDICQYDISDIKQKIQPPIVRNSRGVWSVPEMVKYRKR